MRTNYYLTDVTVPEGIWLRDFDQDLTRMILSELHTVYDENVEVNVQTVKSSWKQDFRAGIKLGLTIGIVIGLVVSLIVYLLPL